VPLEDNDLMNAFSTVNSFIALKIYKERETYKKEWREESRIRQPVVVIRDDCY